MGVFDLPSYGYPMDITSQSGTGYQVYGALDRRLLSFPRTAVINDGSLSSPATGPPNPRALQPPVIVPQMPSLTSWRGPLTQTALRPEINDVRIINLDVFDGHLAESAGVVGGLSDGLMPGSSMLGGLPAQMPWEESQPRLEHWPRHQGNPQTAAWPSSYEDPKSDYAGKYSGGNSPGNWVPVYTGP